LYSDGPGYGRKGVGIVDRKSTAPRYFRDVCQQPGSQALLRSGKVTVVDSHAVKHHVGLSHQGLDLALGVAAVVISTVGDDKERLPAVSCLAHLGNAQVDRIDQSRSSPGEGMQQPGLNVFDRSSEIAEFFRAVSECNQEKFVLWIGRL